MKRFLRFLSISIGLYDRNTIVITIPDYFCLPYLIYFGVNFYNFRFFNCKFSLERNNCGGGNLHKIYLKT